MRFLAALILAVLPAAVPAAAQQLDLNSPELRISYENFKTLYDAGKIVVVDTRDEASFAMGHIPGARVIPADEIPKHLAELRRLKKPIVTYCS